MRLRVDFQGRPWVHWGKGSMKRSRSGSISSVGEPETRARVGEFGSYKEGKGVGVVQREGTVRPPPEV